MDYTSSKLFESVWNISSENFFLNGMNKLKNGDVNGSLKDFFTASEFHNELSIGMLFILYNGNYGCNKSIKMRNYYLRLLFKKNYNQKLLHIIDTDTNTDIATENKIEKKKKIIIMTIIMIIIIIIFSKKLIMLFIK